MEQAIGYFFTLYLPSHVFFVTCREQLARWFARVLKRHDVYGRDYNTLWIELDAIKFHRKIAIVLLLIAITATAVGSFILIPQVLSVTQLSLHEVEFLFVAASFVPLGIYIIERTKRYGVGSFREVEHGKKAEVSSIIESLGVASGIGAVQFCIIGHGAPTVFTAAPLYGSPVIYITSTFLNLAEHSELEAVIAHEYSQIVSGRIHDHKIIEILTVTWQAFAFLFFVFLVLAFVDPEFGAFIAMVSLSLVMPEKKSLYISVNEKPPVEYNSVIDFFLPPFALVHFCSDVIKYYFTSDESYWADLYAVYITRHPRALYSILHKLRSTGLVYESLPKDLESAYFTHNFYYMDAVSLYPQIDERLQNLSLIDNTLSEKSVYETLQKVVCPLCNHVMEVVQGKSLYGADVYIDVCKQCGSIWYDNLELYMASDIGEISFSDKTVHERSAYDCPKCSTALFHEGRADLPSDLEIWHCQSCNGNFLEQATVHRFMDFRREQIARMKGRS